MRDFHNNTENIVMGINIEMHRATRIVERGVGIACDLSSGILSLAGIAYVYKEGISADSISCFSGAVFFQVLKIPYSGRLSMKFEEAIEDSRSNIESIPSDL